MTIHNASLDVVPQESPSKRRMHTILFLFGLYLWSENIDTFAAVCDSCRRKHYKLRGPDKEATDDNQPCEVSEDAVRKNETSR